MTSQPTGVSVETAMQRIERRGFLRPESQELADADHPLAIGHGQTNSQPTTVANMLNLLRVPPRAKVLDVGSGSGWTTALLAYLVGSEGTVLGLELNPELAQWGAQNLAQHKMSWARIEQARPSELGRPVPGGYDRILVSAAASSLPHVLVAQLAQGARMVIPVQNTLLLVERAPFLDEGPRGEPSELEDWGLQADALEDPVANEQIRITEHGGYTFVPLLD